MTSLFGWSAGDIAAAIEFLYNIAIHYRAHGGAVTKLDEARNTLKAMKQVLDLLAYETQNTTCNDDATKAVLGLLDCADVSWLKYYEYLRDFDKSLRPGSSSSIGLRTMRHFQFTYDELHDQMAKFENTISRPLQMISVVRSQSLYDHVKAAMDRGLSSQEKADVISAMHLALDQTIVANFDDRLGAIEMNLLSSHTTVMRSFAETQRLGNAVDLLARRTEQIRRPLATSPSSGSLSSPSRPIHVNGLPGAPFDLDFEEPQLELLKLCTTLSQQLKGISTRSATDDGFLAHATGNCRYSARTLACMMTASVITTALVVFNVVKTTIPTSVSSPPLALPPPIPASGAAGGSASNPTSDTNWHGPQAHTKEPIRKSIQQSPQESQQPTQHNSVRKEVSSPETGFPQVPEAGTSVAGNSPKWLPSSSSVVDWLKPTAASQETSSTRGTPSTDDEGSDGTEDSSITPKSSSESPKALAKVATNESDVWIRCLLRKFHTELLANREHERRIVALYTGPLEEPPYPGSAEFPGYIDWYNSLSLGVEVCLLESCGVYVTRDARCFPMIPADAFGHEAPGHEQALQASASLATLKQDIREERLPPARVVKSHMQKLRELHLPQDRIKQAFASDFDHTEWYMAPQPSKYWTMQFLQHVKDWVLDVSPAATSSRQVSEASDNETSIGWPGASRYVNNVVVATPSEYQRPNSSQLLWSEALEGHCYMDGRTDELVLPDGSRVPRPQSFDKSTDYRAKRNKSSHSESQHCTNSREAHDHQDRAVADQVERKSREPAHILAAKSEARQEGVPEPYVLVLFETLTNMGQSKKDATTHLQTIARTYIDKSEAQHEADDYDLYCRMLRSGMSRERASWQIKKVATTRTGAAELEYTAENRSELLQWFLDRNDSQEEARAKVESMAQNRDTKAATNFTSRDAIKYAMSLEANGHAHTTALKSRARPQLASQDTAVFLVMICAGWSKDEALENLAMTSNVRTGIRQPKLAEEDAALLVSLTQRGNSLADSVVSIVQRSAVASMPTASHNRDDQERRL